MRSGKKPSRVNWWPNRGRAVYPIVFAVKHGSVAQLEWPNQFVLMYIMASFACTIERITSASPLLPRAIYPGGSHARVPPRSLPFPSRFTCALVIRRSSRCGGIVYVDAYNDNALVHLHIQPDEDAETSIMTVRP